MLDYVSYAILIISVGLTAYGIMLSTFMRKAYPVQIISSLIYYQAFVFAFGFYGLWGRAIFEIYITDLLNEQVRERISTLSTLQGFPFLILAWYMMVRFIREIFQYKMGAIFNIMFILFSCISFGALIWFISRPESDPNYFYFIFYSILAAIIQGGLAIYIILFTPKNKRIHSKKLLFLASFIFIFTVIQLTILNLTSMTGYYALAFILSFFIIHAGIPIIVRYSDILKPLSVDSGFSGTFETFCNKNEISPRESEIIIEICKGLTNKEISESLFISVQTVKDHTHRIYIKTGSRNRVDLINRLKDIL